MNDPASRDRVALRYLDRDVELCTQGLRLLGVLETPAAERPIASLEQIRQALARPIGQPLGPFEVVHPGERAVILVSDWSRKTAVNCLLPALFAEWSGRGISPRDLTILFACGAHRVPTEKEMEVILGREFLRTFQPKVAIHQAKEESLCVDAGTTSRGTRVRLNRLAVEADRLILTGAVKFHYFAGFTGGRKAVLPGIAAASTISQNHSLNIDKQSLRLNPEVRIGRLDGNPVSEDMDEGARMIRVDAIINTVLDGGGQVAGVFCGDMIAAHRQAVAFAERLFRVGIPERADLVVAASNDRNWIQSHKCLYNASSAVKLDGLIVLMAPCPEGYGSESFSRWVRLGDEKAILRGLCRESEINGQTALSTLMRGRRTICVSEMDDEHVRRLKMTPAKSLDEAMRIALEKLRAAGRPIPSTYVLPDAGNTTPFCAEAECLRNQA